MPSNISINKKLNSKLSDDSSFLKDVAELLRKEMSKKTTESSIPSKNEDLKSNIKNDEEFSENVNYLKVMTESEKNFLSDALKSYEIYFPNNNVENVLSLIEERRLRKILRKKKTKNNFKKMDTMNFSPTRRRGFTNNLETMKSKVQQDLDKDKIIKILKEQERKTRNKKGRVKRFKEWILGCINRKNFHLRTRKSTKKK